MVISKYDVRAVNCVQCHQCEAKCPQHIPISMWLAVVHRALGEGQPFQISLWQAVGEP